MKVHRAFLQQWKKIFVIVRNIFFKMGQCGLVLPSLVFSYLWLVGTCSNWLPGFEPQTSCVESIWSANRAITTAQMFAKINNLILYYFLQCLGQALTALHLHNPLLENDMGSISISTVHKLSSSDEKLLAEPGIKPEAAGWEAQTQPLCYAALPNLICYY